MGTYLPFGGEAAAPPPLPMPSPPRLHWGWVLGLNMITRSLFGIAWLIVQANWVRKVRGKSSALTLAMAHCFAIPALFLVGIAAGLMGDTAGSTLITVATVIGGVGIVVLWIATVFTLRRELSESPIDIPLGGVMTFFFGPIYFQYFLRDYDGGGGGGRAADGVLGLSGPKA